MGPKGSRSLRLPGFSDSRHVKVARLSAFAPAVFILQGRSLVLVSARG
jgi:hypothetical protein